MGVPPLGPALNASITVLGALLGRYGCPIVLVGTLVGHLLGALYGIGMMLVGRADRRSRIPFDLLLRARTLAGVGFCGS
ncbi:type IV peptidase [Streptomyces sp. SLBN-31]|uniref:type IV peptidase n=1 Tax=Streptomyces sp. SLBN-31 TaxID=2768444 RepID=UPI00114F843F|nr:type IV peptidase [Streptomyces sp. SLBN-31]